jgi:5-methylcytosine-specific restriction endonuclease McrA
MNTLKRLPIKYIRDKAKKAYEKETNCFVCDSKAELELHHVYSISELFNRWCRKQGVTIKTEDDILVHRESFIQAHHKEIYIDVRTLCKRCHFKLHSLFGQHPPLPTGEKQLNYLGRARDKFREING